MENHSIQVLLDCEEGRRMGCESYCCCLIVRLSEEEAKAFGGRRVLGKDADEKYCEYFDRETKRCLIWEQRPSVCRSYNCNTDRLLQIVFHEGFTSLVPLLTSDPFIRAHEKRFVPTLPNDAEQLKRPPASNLAESERSELSNKDE